MLHTRFTEKGYPRSQVTNAYNKTKLMTQEQCLSTKETRKIKQAIANFITTYKPFVSVKGGMISQELQARGLVIFYVL